MYTFPSSEIGHSGHPREYAHLFYDFLIDCKPFNWWAISILFCPSLGLGLSAAGQDAMPLTWLKLLFGVPCQFFYFMGPSRPRVGTFPTIVFLPLGSCSVKNENCSLKDQNQQRVFGCSVTTFDRSAWSCNFALCCCMYSMYCMHCMYCMYCMHARMHACMFVCM